MDLNLYLKQLETLVNIDSGSRNTAGVNKVADEIESWYRGIGWHVINHGVGPEAGRLMEICNRPADHYDVMFVGHMDTVFPDGTAAQRPFHMDEENVYGPGVGDMKNGDTAMFHVALNTDPAVLDKLNICMLYNPDEEIGSRYSREKMDEIGKKADYIIVMESAGNKGTRHCFARKGSMGYELEFHGQAAHAGFMFSVENASAILEMGHYIVELMGLASREEDTTVNVGVVSGGTANNVVADFAKLSVEMRFKKESERIRLEQAVDKMVNGEPFVKGVRTEVVKHRSSPPMMKSEKTAAFVKRLQAMADELQIHFEEKDRGGLSDANHLSRCGDAVILDGMGPHGALDHSEKEYGYYPSAVDCVRLLCRMLEEISKDKSEMEK